jgi:tripartite-type tricarboxylate transporter receptor subunit TctC
MQNRVILAAFAAGLVAGTAHAQGFPTKPIRLIVPYPAGGSGIDLVSRLSASQVSETIGQPVIVDNRPGGSGFIGTGAVARSAPDGYTLVFGTPSTHALPTLLHKSVPFDPIKDFTPVVTLTEVVMALVVHPSVPAANVKELLDHARRYPGKLAYGSNGQGSTFHFATEMFRVAVGGFDMVHVPYKGNSEVAAALARGDVQMAMSGITSVLGLVRAGKARALAVLESSRYPGLPDVPLIGETAPGFRKPAAWYMILGPAGTPQPVVSRLNAEFVRAMGDAEVRAKLDASGLAPVGNTPEQSAELVRQAYDVYRAAIHAAGIKPE